MKTEVFTEIKITRSNFIVATYKGKTITLPFGQRYLLHPGYVEGNYLNSSYALLGKLSSIWDEEVVQPGNPYYSYGVSEHMAEKYYHLHREQVARVVKRLLSLLEEIKNNGGYLKYNHPEEAARRVKSFLNSTHSSFYHYIKYSPLSIKDIRELESKYELNLDYPKIMYPEL